MRRYIFRQLFEKESSTYTYILGDLVSKKAIIIDPVLETVERDVALLNELDLSPRYAINTHAHADHITGTYKLKQAFPDIITAISEASHAAADLKLNEGDILEFGDNSLRCIATPGHTVVCTEL